MQRLHEGEKPIHAAGTFRVKHGRSFLAWLARLPAAGEIVNVRLVLTPKGLGEEWQRTFAGRPFVSFQTLRPDGLLAERIGLLELRFCLSVDSGGLLYRSVSAAFCVGPLRLPLPHGTSSWTTAWEKPGATPGQIHVRVEVRLPLVGVILVYEGGMAIEEPA